MRNDKTALVGQGTPVGVVRAADVPDSGTVSPESLARTWSNETVRLRVDHFGALPVRLPEGFEQALHEPPLAGNRGAISIMIADAWSNASEQARIWPPGEFDAEELSVWVLNGAHVMGGAITSRRPPFHYDGQLLLTASGDLVPGSYGVLDGSRSLPGDLLEANEAGDGYLLKAVAEPRMLEGSYYFLGSVHRHFGHALVEGVSRLWAAPLVDESMRFLVYEDVLAKHNVRLLARAGIDESRIVHASPHDVVERLIVPDLGMRTHRWITEAQGATWASMRGQGTGEAPHRKVYLSRRGTAARPLVVEQEVEEIFADAGYEIVRPETLGIDEQIDLAAESISLAGCVGSQMYLAAFQLPGASNIVLAPRNFFLIDDLLVSASTGSRLRVLFGSSVDFQAPKPERVWGLDLRRLRELVHADGN